MLATTDPQKVPITVLSRCLQFNLRPMAPETVHEHLTQVLAQEQIDAEPGALRLLSRAARGSMRDALSLTDQAIAFGAGQLDEAGIRQMLGSADRTHVFALIDALARGDGKSVVETSEALRVQGLNAAATLEDMSAVLQRMAVMQAVPEMGAAAENDPEHAEIARLAAVLPADETQLLYSLCLHGRQELGLAPDEYAALTMVLLRLLAFKAPAPAVRDAAPLAEKKSLNDATAPVTPAPPKAMAVPAKAASVAQVSATEVPAPVQALPVRDMAAQRPQPTAPMPAQAAAPDPASAPVSSPATTVAVPIRQQPEPRLAVEQPSTAPASLTPTPEGDFWYGVVQGLVQAEAVTALARELALQSQLVGRDSDSWMLRVERESLNSPNTRDRLQSALAGAGHPVRLMVEVGRVSDSPALRNAAAAAERQLQAETVILHDPMVQGLMRDFGAKIVPGSIKPL